MSPIRAIRVVVTIRAIPYGGAGAGANRPGQGEMIAHGSSLSGMATQIITLIGVLIGALTSYLATAMAERAKFRRLMATRWDERKLDTYIEYVTCIKEIQRAAMDAGRARDRGEDAPDALAEMEESERRRSVLFESFVLLSDERSAAAAHLVNQRTWELLRAARDASNGMSVLRPIPLVEALNVLHEAARADLTIVRGDAVR